jgi:hypothetical protein
MQAELYKAYQKLEGLKSAAFSHFSGYTDEQLNTPSVPGKWGALQHIAHILSSERMSLKYMKKKIQGLNDAGKSGLSERFRAWLLVMALKSNLKFKAPDVLEEPENHYNLQELFDLWTRERAEFEAFLNTLNDEAAHARIFKHPVAGKMNPIQALTFMGVHLERHLNQAKEILKK